MKITKKILLSLWLCVATNMLHASVEDLIDKLGECKDGMDKLVQALGDIGKAPDEGDGGTGAPPPPPPGGPGDLGGDAPPPPEGPTMGAGSTLTWQQKIALTKAAAKKAGKKPVSKPETGGEEEPKTGGKPKAQTATGPVAGLGAAADAKFAKRAGKDDGNEQGKVAYTPGGTPTPDATAGERYGDWNGKGFGQQYTDGFNEGYDIGWKEAEAKAASASPKPKTPEPKKEEKKEPSPKIPAKTPSTGPKVEPKKPTVTPPPGAKKPEAKFAAPKKEEKLQDFTGKIDYLEIPNYEELYQAFLAQYFQGVFNDSRLGRDLKETSGWSRPFSQYSERQINDIKDAIGRAIFERNILRFCREQIIEKYDKTRKSSGQKPTWVYEGYLKGIIQLIITSQDQKTPQEFVKAANIDVKDGEGKDVTIAGQVIHDLLAGAAADTSQAIGDMFYHKERREGSDRVNCDCLTNTLENGHYTGSGVNNTIGEDKRRIPKDHVLFNPINYLIFEVMHITLFHGYYFINELIVQLFDFSKPLEAEVVKTNKTKFKVGYDKVFSDQLDYIVGKIAVAQESGGTLTPEDKTILTRKTKGVKAAEEKTTLVSIGSMPPPGLMMRQQKNYEDQPILLLDGQPRFVIYGKRMVSSDRSGDLYWCQTGYEKFPDGVSRSTVRGYNKQVTKDELTFAVWYHLLRHTCYSVGLLPENLMPVLDLKDEVRAKVIEIEAESHVNEDVKKLLLKKAEGLKRVLWVVAYLKPAFIALKKIQPMEIVSILKEIDNGTKNPENKNKGVQLKSITQDEWNKIFQKLYEDPACAKKVGEVFSDVRVKPALGTNIADLMTGLSKKVSDAIIEAQAAAAA